MSQKSPKKDKPQRIEIIIKGIVDGTDFNNIAQTCGVDRRTIFRDRQSIQYHQLFNPLLDKYLRRLSNAEIDDKLKALSLKELGATVRAMIPTRIEAKTEGAEEIRIIIEDNAVADDKVETTPGPKPDPQKQS